MDVLKRSILYILFSMGILLYAHGQQSIGGVVNSYYKVISVSGSTAQMDSNADLSDLSPGDKVLLVQMTGITINTSGSWVTTNQSWQQFYDAGKYELLSVGSVNNGVHTVGFTATVSATFTTGEKIQLVKIFEADYATVNNPLTASAWDGDTGGILAMVIFKKLTLNTNIDVSGKGFRGAGPEPDYSAGCRGSIPDTFYFPSTKTNVAGNKGEGPITASFTYTKGPGRLLTGGGGGLGYFAGGGGGSNFGKGGSGGIQASSCTADVSRTMGGVALDITSIFYDLKRVTMGGGGGSSTENSSYSATKGGNGGGIVLLLVDTLDANGYSITSNGEPAVTAEAGAGGGGGGGTILADINVYSDDVNMNVRGGNGGTTESRLNGSGGGGGGGLIRVSQSSMPGQISYSYAGGTYGAATNSPQRGEIGDPGGTYYSLRLPLNGFLFNSVNGVDTICEGQRPGRITGSMPKGGTGSYTYQWLQSADGISWSNASGDKDSLHIDPYALTQTTYYTRIVTSGAVTDTAFSVKVFVYPAITGNFLSIRDSICPGASPGTLSASAPGGGDGMSYSYRWETRANGGIWYENDVYSPSFTEGNLSATQHYRRIVTSAKVCVDTSNADTITVMLPIINNLAAADTEICFGARPLPFTETAASGGAGNYSYLWQWRPEGSSVWSDAPEDLSMRTLPSYSSDNLMSTTQFRRRVISKTCESYSNPVLVTVFPFIINNLIVDGMIQYGCYNSSNLISGSYPDGGDTDGTYRYQWQQSPDSISWESAGGTFSGQNYTTQYLIDSAFFRRIVLSGDHDQCIDTSAKTLLRLNPLPSGLIENRIDTACRDHMISIRYGLEGAGPWNLTLGDENHATTFHLSQDTGEVNFNATADANIRILEIEDDSLCYADTTTTTGEIELTVYENPEANAGINSEVCGPVTLLSATPSIGRGEWISTFGSFADPASPLTVYTAGDYGEASIVWTESNWNCTDADTVHIVFFEQPISANAGEDMILNYTFDTILGAEAPPVGQGLWSVISGNASIPTPDQHNSTIRFENVGDYLLGWYVNNGVCVLVADSVRIVVGDLKIFNGFSPNNDGINDEFILELSDRYVSELTILDHYGSVIIQLEGSSKIKWDGTSSKGKPLPEGTYFYIIKESGRPDRKGYIELRR